MWWYLAPDSFVLKNLVVIQFRLYAQIEDSWVQNGDDEHMNERVSLKETFSVCGKARENGDGGYNG